jgi:hypothetical protein
MQGKTFLLTSLIGAATLRLLEHACTTHTQFRIPIRGYPSTLSKHSNILQTLQNAHVIIIDKMSMMTSTMLRAIEQCFKKIQNNTNPFTNVLVLLVGDFIQMSAICRHSLRTNELYCKKFHISIAPS